MPQIDLHELGVEAQELRAELTAVLDAQPGPHDMGLQTLSEELPSLVFTGAFSTGKSTLIAALTDRTAEVVIGADVTTDALARFTWSDVVTLVDTPGMHAGVQRHDRLAEDAVRAADLVIFCVSVDMFDDDSTGLLRHILDDLAKRDQTIVVITKTDTLEASPGTRAELVASAAGDPRFPFVEVAAQLYLDALDETDAGFARQLAEASNMQALAEQINAISRDQGQVAQLLRPFQQIRAAAQELQASLVPDPSLQATLLALNRQQKSLEDRADRIRLLLARRANSYELACRHAAERYAEQVESWDDASHVTSDQRQSAELRLTTDLDDAWTAFTTEIEAIVLKQMDELSVEIDELDSSALVTSLKKLATDFPSPTSDAPSSPLAGESDNTWLGRIRKEFDNFATKWGSPVNNRGKLNQGQLLIQEITRLAVPGQDVGSGRGGLKR